MRGWGIFGCWSLIEGSLGHVMVCGCVWYRSSECYIIIINNRIRIMNGFK